MYDLTEIVLERLCTNDWKPAHTQFFMLSDSLVVFVLFEFLVQVTAAQLLSRLGSEDFFIACTRCGFIG